jgi:hypothetical protein
MVKKPKPQLKPQPEKESCESCRFYLPNKDDPYGYCRRYPPTFVTTDEGGGFMDPSTEDSDWCGEFSRKLQS